MLEASQNIQARFLRKQGLQDHTVTECPLYTQSFFMLNFSHI